jgi:opacity protein-like surface antigen
MKKLLFLVTILAVASVASAALAGGPISVGIEAGMVNTEIDEFDNTWMAGAFVDVGLPMLNWYIQPFINYWNWSERISVSGADLETPFSDWTVGGNVKMAIPTASMVRPFLGAGVAAHVLTAESQVEFLGETLSVDASDTKLGFQLGGGVHVDAGETWSIVAQSWYHMVDEFNQWSIRGGIAWNL